MTVDAAVIAVVGPSSTKAALVAALAARHTRSAPAETHSAEPNADSPPPPTVWRLDTKYYTADVTITRSQPLPGAAAGADAVVLTTRHGAADAWTALTAWADADAPDVDAAAVKLVCAVCDGSAGVGEGAWWDAARAWCADRSFELVAAAPHDAVVDAELAADGDGGVARVADALIVHAWPGLKRKVSGARPVEDPTDEPSTSSPTEADLDAVDALMADLTATRARLATLPDAERRAGAAVAAVRLAAALGLGADEIEEEGRSSESE